MYEQLKSIIHSRKSPLFTEGLQQLYQACHLALKAKEHGQEELVALNIGYAFDMLDWLRRQNATGVGNTIESFFLINKPLKDFEQLEKFIEEEFFADFPELPDELTMPNTHQLVEAQR